MQRIDYGHTSVAFTACLLEVGAAHEVIQAGHPVHGRLLRRGRTADVQALQTRQQIACT